MLVLTDQKYAFNYGRTILTVTCKQFKTVSSLLCDLSRKRYVCNSKPKLHHFLIVCSKTITGSSSRFCTRLMWSQQFAEMFVLETLLPLTNKKLFRVTKCIFTPVFQLQSALLLIFGNPTAMFPERVRSHHLLRVENFHKHNEA